MAKILADKDIKKIIGTIIKDADEQYINPNGIELRLGKRVRFHSTGETKELESGQYIKVNPGETVVISSFEKINFSRETVNLIYPNSNLMGLITPTTTMMREGISQVSTKIDSGFRGILNWSLRNGSTKDLFLQQSEPILKLTLFLLDKDESPEIIYGERVSDSYQDSEGIVPSARKIEADIPKDKIVSSSFDKIDPKKQLKEAGYPFNHIGTELIALDGKIVQVSSDVSSLKKNFDERTKELTKKIEEETGRLTDKLDDFRKRFFEQVNSIFDKKFIRIVGVLITALTILYTGINFLHSKNIGASTLFFIAIIFGMVILSVIYILGRK